MIVDDIPSLRRILQECRTIAMVGLSERWYRPSYFAAKYLLEYGYRVIPVNPNAASILGEKSYARLEDINEPVDVVDVFQRSEVILPIAESALHINARVLWLQLGIFNQAAVDLASRADIDLVIDRCMKIEHARLFGGLNFIGVDTQVISSARTRYMILW